MTNKEISTILKEVSVYKELKGENSFKIRAFEKASRTVERCPESIELVAEEGNLQKLEGVGKSVEEIIFEIIENHKSAHLEELKASFPATIAELLTIPGMGPKKVRAVWEKLGVATIGELEYAIKENRLLTLEGFGKKSQDRILSGIVFRKRYQDLHLFSEVLDIALEVTEKLKSTNLFKNVEIAGSLRRGKTFFKDINILVVTEESIGDKRIADCLFAFADDENSIIEKGKTKISVRRKGIQIDFRIVDGISYPSALQHFTGSNKHNTIIRSRAKNIGIKLNEWGVFKGEKRIPLSTEGDVYRSIGLAFIPPEIREGFGEIEASESGNLPELVIDDDIIGMIHVHSNYSDGINSIEEIAKKCGRLGYKYLCISDHSRSAFYANGLSKDRLLQQIEEIKQLNSNLSPFRIFSGIESDILSDGSLDYEDNILKELDFVIGSIHSNLRMDKDTATKRLLNAIKNPWLTIIGHISGRILLSREGYPFDAEEILEALKDENVVIEHNCNPHRLDPDWDFLKVAKDKGILISLGTDAHSLDGLLDMKYGVIMARKAWLEKKDIINCKASEEIDDFFRRRKEKKSG